MICLSFRGPHAEVQISDTPEELRDLEFSAYGSTQSFGSGSGYYIYVKIKPEESTSNADCDRSDSALKHSVTLYLIVYYDIVAPR